MTSDDFFWTIYGRVYPDAVEWTCISTSNGTLCYSAGTIWDIEHVVVFRVNEVLCEASEVIH